MKRIINKIKWAFFDCPKTAAEWASQNETKMTYMGNFIIFITLLSVIITTVINFLNMP